MQYALIFYDLQLILAPMPLFLPESWGGEQARRATGRVPTDGTLQTKPGGLRLVRGRTGRPVGPGGR